MGERTLCRRPEPTGPSQWVSCPGGSCFSQLQLLPFSLFQFRRQDPREFALPGFQEGRGPSDALWSPWALVSRNLRIPTFCFQVPAGSAWHAGTVFSACGVVIICRQASSYSSCYPGTQSVLPGKCLGSGDKGWPRGIERKHSLVITGLVTVTNIEPGLDALSTVISWVVLTSCYKISSRGGSPSHHPYIHARARACRHTLTHMHTHTWPHAHAVSNRHPPELWPRAPQSVQLILAPD